MSASPRSSQIGWPHTRELLILAGPVLIEQMLQFSVAFVDTYLSGRFGASATEAVGLAAYFSWLASTVCGLAGTGAAALVARAIGRGAREEASVATSQTLVLAVLCGLVAGACAERGAPWAADGLGLAGESREIAVRFLRIDACGYPPWAVTLAGTAALRGAGDMWRPLWALGAASLGNLVFSYGFVYGLGPFPAWGVDGIAVGAACGRWLAAAIMLGLLMSRSSPVALTRTWTLDFVDTTRRIVRIGVPAMIDGMMAFAGHFLFLAILRRSGGDEATATFAAHVVGIQVEAISSLPAQAIGAAAATLAGQSLGRGDVDRAMRVVKTAARIAVTYAVLMTVCFWATARPIYSLMHVDPAVWRIGTPAFQLMAMYQVPNAVLIVLSSALRGAGDTRFPMLNAILGCLLVRTSVAYVCGVMLGGGLLGSWIGMGADNITRAALVAWRFRSRRWTRISV